MKNKKKHIRIIKKILNSIFDILLLVILLFLIIGGFKYSDTIKGIHYLVVAILNLIIFRKRIDKILG